MSEKDIESWMHAMDDGRASVLTGVDVENV
jgi:hypothetical protein